MSLPMVANGYEISDVSIMFDSGSGVISSRDELKPGWAVGLLPTPLPRSCTTVVAQDILHALAPTHQTGFFMLHPSPEGYYYAHQM